MPTSTDRKRVSVHLKLDAYKALRMFAAETGETHQDIIEGALLAHLKAKVKLLP